MYSILDFLLGVDLGTIPHWLWLPAGNHPESSPRHGRHHRNLHIKEKLASLVLFPCLPEITAPPTESLESFSYKVLSTLLWRVGPPCFFRWAGSPFDPIHINDHSTLFSSLRYLFFFVVFSPKCHSSHFYHHYVAEGRELCVVIWMGLFFICKRWERCSVPTPAVHQLNQAQSYWDSSIYTHNTDKPLGLSKQDWPRISLVNLIWRWKGRAGANSIENVPKICFHFGFWQWAASAEWWWGDGAVSGQNKTLLHSHISATHHYSLLLPVFLQL